jgi:predicted CoA-binding protein
MQRGGKGDVHRINLVGFEHLLVRAKDVRNRKAEFTTEIAKIRSELGRAIAEVNFLPNLSKYLLENSHFELFFVNPLLDEVLGQKVYKSLKEIPVPIDIVDVFRKPSDCIQVLEESIEIGAKAIWLQLGISVEEVESQGEEAGLTVVMDRCIKIDYAAM